MTVSRVRLIAVAALSLLIVGGCSVPGKGDPGVVAVYRGNVITEDNVLALDKVMSGELLAPPIAGEDLTLLLIGPQVVACAEQHGYGEYLTNDALASRARQWVSYTKQGRPIDVTVTPDGLGVVRVVEAINLLMHDPGDGFICLFAVLQDVEENAVISPRYGDFTMEAFSESIRDIDDYIQAHETELSFAQFLFWKGVDGFGLVEEGPVLAKRPEWISSE